MSENDYTLDDTDKQILNTLTQQARIANLALADAVHLSPTPCARRVTRLEDIGIITGYHARLDKLKLNLQLSVFIAVTMDKHTPERFATFEQCIQGFPEVIRASVVTGRVEDYLLQVIVKDMAEFESFLLGKLTKVPGVANVHSSFEMRSVIDREIVI